MKYTYGEYYKMIKQLNLNRNKYVLIIGTVITFVGSFFINYIQDNKLFINLLTAVICSIIFYYIMRNIIINNARKLNKVNKFIEMKQEMSEEFIIEIEKTENKSIGNKYLYSDVVKVREDKFNFYLYLAKNKALVVSKEKLDNIKEFKQIINDKIISK